MRRLLALTAVVAALSAACGGSDDPVATGHVHEAAPISSTRPSHSLVASLTRARLATTQYALDLEKAKADGYKIITPNMPDMGYHFLNPAISGFDVTKPHILVYLDTPRGWQLGALEWVFTERPAKPPLPGATYGSFGAACHYEDGTFVFTEAESECAPTSPETGSPFGFWHPDLVTLHVWLWYPNPDGLYAGNNRFVHLFNDRAPHCRPRHPC